MIWILRRGRCRTYSGSSHLHLVSMQVPIHLLGSNYLSSLLNLEWAFYSVFEHISCWLLSTNRYVFALYFPLAILSWVFWAVCHALSLLSNSSCMQLYCMLASQGRCLLVLWNHRQSLWVVRPNALSDPFWSWLNLQFDFQKCWFDRMFQD